MKSPSDYLIRLQDRVGKLLDANGTRMPAFNDAADHVIARYALANVIKKKAEALCDEAKDAVLEQMQSSIGILAEGAPAMNIHASSFVSLNAEKRGRETIDNKAIINGLIKLAEDNPKLKQRIDGIIAGAKKKSYALYLTPTLNGVPD